MALPCHSACDAELLDMLQGTFSRLGNAAASVALLEPWYPELRSFHGRGGLQYGEVCDAVRRLLDLPVTYDEEILGLIAYVVLRGGDALHVDIDRAKLAPLLDVLSDVALGNAPSDRVSATLCSVDGIVHVVARATGRVFVLTDQEVEPPGPCGYLHRTTDATGSSTPQLDAVVSTRCGDGVRVYEPHACKTMSWDDYVEYMENSGCYEIVRYVLWPSTADCCRGGTDTT